jgi:hypothetical protein
MVIAVDFDLTLCGQRPAPGKMGVPEPGALLSMKKLNDEGHTLIIFTARNVQDPRVKKAVSDWLDYFNIPYHGISNIKSPAYDVIIDDRAIHYEDWTQVVSDLTRLANNMHVPVAHITKLIDDITIPIDISTL